MAILSSAITGISAWAGPWNAMAVWVDGVSLQELLIIILSFFLLIFFFCSFRADMVAAIKKVAQMNVNLSMEEMILLYSAYKNVIGPILTSWQTVADLETETRKDKGDDAAKPVWDKKRAVVFTVAFWRPGC